MDADHADEIEAFLRADEDISDIRSEVSFYDSDESNEVSQNDPSGMNEVLYMPVPVRCRVLTQEEQVWPSATRMRVLKHMR